MVGELQGQTWRFTGTLNGSHYAWGSFVFSQDFRSFTGEIDVVGHHARVDRTQIDTTWSPRTTRLFESSGQHRSPLRTHERVPLAAQQGSRERHPQRQMT